MRGIDLDRRQFLKSLGAAAVSLPLSKVLLKSAAYAQTAPAPLRFVAIFTPHGCPYNYWRPQGGETDFNLNFDKSVLLPLDGYRQKMLILDGVDFAVSHINNATGHNAIATLLTGSAVDSSGKPSNESIDNFLARNLGDPSPTPFRLMRVGTGCLDSAAMCSITFGQGGNFEPGEVVPMNVWNNYFASLVPPNDPNASATAQRGRRRHALVDFLKADLARLQSRAPQAAKVRLDTQMAALRDMEQRITQSVPASCTKPEQPKTWDESQYYCSFQGADPNDAPTLTDLQSDMIATAFACDLTRIATLQVDYAGAPAPMPFLGSTFNTDVHENVAHQAGQSGAGATSTGSQNLAVIQNYYAQRVKYLVDKLAQAGVLDDTIVLWGNELGDPSAHMNVNVPFVILGGCGGKFRMGRYLRYSTDLSSCIGASQCGNTLTPHNQLLVSIAQAFGNNITQFGWTGSTGPLPGLV